MGNHQYYTLLASLPPLPRFDRTERIPITRERLLQRCRMLTPEDAVLFEYAVAFLSWQRQAATRTDEEMIANFRKMESSISHPELKSLFAFPINLRTIMAALRRRHRGFSTPSPGEPWGVGQYVRHIENNWEDPNLRLNSVYPWILQVRSHMEAGDTLALERLLSTILWDHVDRSVEPYDFGFHAVLAYIIKWDIIHQWLSYNIENAKERFEELVAEVTDEQQQRLN